MKAILLILLSLTPMFGFAQKTPTLTHKQKVQLFSYDDQRSAILVEYQNKFLAAVKPVQNKENKFIKKLEAKHPGYVLVYQPSKHEWEYAVKPQQPKKK